MRLRVCALMFLLLALLAGGLFAQIQAATSPRVTVSVGHAGAVRAVSSTADGAYAVSAGDDGTVKLWSLEHDGLFTSYQLSRNPITHVAVHPTRTELVVYSSHGVRGGTIAAIDWLTGSRLFSTDVDTSITLLEYSPAGTYVVFARSTFDSLRFLSADRGELQPFMRDGFGVVSYVLMASGERNIMTYVPSRGEFTYWQLATGAELQRVSTRARLEQLTNIDPVNRRLLAAAGANELVVVDNLTGEVRASYPVAPIHGITFDRQTGTILVLTDQLGRRDTLAFTYSAGALRRSAYRPQGLPDDTLVLEALAGARPSGMVSGNQAGLVARHLPSTGRRVDLGPSAVRTVRDMAVTDGSLYLSLDDRLLRFDSDLFADTTGKTTVSTLRETWIDPPFARPQIAADGSQLLLWGDQSAPGTIWGLSPFADFPMVVALTEHSAPIAAVRRSPFGPLLVHRDGRVARVALDGTVEFLFTAIGLQDAAWDSAAGLVAAKTRSTSFDSSLIVVDQRTGETIAASTSAFLTTRVVSDPRTGTLYSLGLVGSQASPATELMRHTQRLTRTDLLLRIEQENPQADLLWDDRTSSLLTSVDPGRVYRFVDGSAELLEPVERLHQKLAVGGHVIASVNADGTVTFWDRRSGDHLVDLWILDAGWIAATVDGAFLASSLSAERYLTLLTAPRLRATVADFRLQLPLTP